MPIIKADDGCPLYVEVEGDDDAPALMLSNSLGTNLHMWDDRCRRGAGISGWCATIAVVMANPACQRGHIRWSASAATCLR